MRMKRSDKRLAVLVSAVAMLFLALGSVGPLTAEMDKGFYYSHYAGPGIVLCKFTGCQLGTCCATPSP